MKPKDMFSLTVRLLGLVFVYHGLLAFPLAIGQISSTFPSAVNQAGSFGAFIGCVIIAVWPLLVAYWLLRGAPLIIRVAYPETPASTTDESHKRV